MIPKIAAVTCLHTSAQLTAMPGRRLHLDKSASAPLRVGECAQAHFIRVKKKGTGAQCLGSRGAGDAEKAFSAEIAVGAAELRKLPMHGVIGIHLINEHRHYRAPIQEYKLQGSAA
jgi:hypothetical protein